jgi:hypothetical protein
MSATTRAAIVTVGQKFGGKDRIATQWIAVCRSLTMDGVAMQSHNRRKSRVIRVQTPREWQFNSIRSQFCLISHGSIVAAMPD